jgi:hypothetical protein
VELDELLNAMDRRRRSLQYPATIL